MTKKRQRNQRDYNEIEYAMNIEKFTCKRKTKHKNIWNLLKYQCPENAHRIKYE